jgi:hypothetical protein
VFSSRSLSARAVWLALVVCACSLVATLVVWGVDLTILARPAHAQRYPPWAICGAGRGTDESVAHAMHLEPVNGATVPAGTAVTFSGESNHVLTFRVASSEGLLSSPDIDSGTGSQSGASYRLTSAKATATPRTIYWTASFTLTPEDCESPSTFTTPVHTLVVVPSEAELATTKRQQEESAKKQEVEAAQKKAEEEAAAKKKEEEVAAAGSVVLDGPTIEVQTSRMATVKLTCSDIATCAGRLTITATATVGKGKTRHARTERIGTASFSIAAGAEGTVKITLDGTGRALVRTAHKDLSATLTIVRTTPSSDQDPDTDRPLADAEGDEDKGQKVAGSLRRRAPNGFAVG